jgi:hypothetical protein
MPQGAGGVYEMSWAGKGRPPFEYGDERIAGQKQVRLGRDHQHTGTMGHGSIAEEPEPATMVAE